MRNDRAKVSIIIPVYNVETYLPMCIESVINQTMHDLEIICVNDGSTDSSLEIINSYAESDNRIIVLTGPNRGYGHAINCGLQIAKGEYIAIVESDDYVSVDMFEKLYNAACEYDYPDIVKSDYVRFFATEKGNTEELVSICPQKEMYKSKAKIVDNPQFFNTAIINQVGIYKRFVFEKYGIKLNESPGAAFQDNGLWFQIFLYSETIVCLDEAYYMYRTDREDSSTNVTSYENAMCIFGEWEFIQGILSTYSGENFYTYLQAYSLRCFTSMHFHFTRVKEEYKLLFLLKFSEVINRLYELNIFKIDLLSPHQCADLVMIKDNPKGYYYDWCARNVVEFCDYTLGERIDECNKHFEKLTYMTRGKRENTIPKVSIIIPVYNAEKYLLRCLKSIEIQTLDDYEIICIDDGSTDKSLDMLIAYSMQNCRVTVQTQSNSGAGIARNRGIDLARGVFVSFIDPDDEYPDEFTLEKLYETAICKNVDICGGNMIVFEPNRVYRNEKITFNCEGYINYCEWQQQYGYTQFIYSRKLLIENGLSFPSYLRFQDPPFLVSVMSKAKKFYVINRDVYKYNWDPSHFCWNERRVNDLIRGITDCISMSAEEGLEKLHLDSVNTLEKVFAERILNNFGKSFETIRLLAIAESKVDFKLLNEADEIHAPKYHLSILDRALEMILNYVPKGYVGPNGTQKRIDIIDSCNELRMKIVMIETSLSYRIGIWLTGGKKRAKKRGEWFDYSDLMFADKKFSISDFEGERARLEKIYWGLFESKAYKKGRLFTKK